MAASSASIFSCVEDVAQARGDGLRRDQLEVVALAAAQDGDRDLVHLGRREDELHVRRRLLERLQEGVPRRVREHVDLVHDVDLEAVARGPEGEPLLEAPHLVDAVVARAVDLLHVDVAARRRSPCTARTPGRAWRSARWPSVWPTQLRHLARRRALVVLPTPRTPGEEEGVRDPALRDGVARACARRAPGRRDPRTTAGDTCARGRGSSRAPR